MNEWMNDWMNEMNEWMNDMGDMDDMEWNECMNERMNAWMNEWMTGIIKLFFQVLIKFNSVSS